MSIYTPGPWYANGPYVQLPSQHKTICRVDHPFPCGTSSEMQVAVSEVNANARLIAAAPDMLEVVKVIATATGDTDLENVQELANKILQKIEVVK